jgi:hypothetical protein
MQALLGADQFATPLNLETISNLKGFHEDNLVAQAEVFVANGIPAECSESLRQDIDDVFEARKAIAESINLADVENTVKQLKSLGGSPGIIALCERVISDEKTMPEYLVEIVRKEVARCGSEEKAQKRNNKKTPEKTHTLEVLPIAL